ncbi:thyrotropin-releasing hormone receptor-like [Dreissena polymorpha]|uniref:thyrotropin-releasing hormone receptor-like n=1 Tax=Dreissena polymorpha TaxID=45954 RepID=UPI002264C97E|nr:thyrotropin-releasing hormone receptor-like [Dreissena polymorpha]
MAHNCSRLVHLVLWNQEDNSFYKTASTQTRATEARNRNLGFEKSSKWASKVMKHLSSSKSSGRQTLRITKMLTFVTIAFVISYLPHLTLMLWSMFVSKEDEDTLPKDNLYQIVFYSFLLNNLVNPFIYATMDEKFKTELKKILKCEFL